MDGLGERRWAALAKRAREPEDAQEHRHETAANNTANATAAELWWRGLHRRWRWRLGDVAGERLPLVG